VQRFLTASYTGWTNIDEGGPVKTEDDPLDADPAAAQRESMTAIRSMEAAVRSAPLEGVVLRYANLYRPRASDSMIVALHKRMFPIIGDGGGIWSWVHVEDAAAATAAALERGRPGVYNVDDDEPAPVAEWVPPLASVVGAPAPLRVPVWLGRLLGGDAVTRYATRGRGSSNAKAETELGWRPARSSWRVGFLELAPDARRMDGHAAG
jgi:nucleoside-diphosphate-sugar epimerase